MDEWLVWLGAVVVLLLALHFLENAGKPCACHGEAAAAPPVEVGCES